MRNAGAGAAWQGPSRLLACRHWGGLAIVLLAVLAFQPASGQLPARQATPDWADTLPLNPDRPFDRDLTVGGVRYLLVESQTNQLTRQQYRRVAYQVLDGQGVRENSSLSLLYSPVETTLALHRLQVIRDGVVDDRLAAQPIRLLEREQSLEQNLYDGRVSVHMLLDDIRVGDIIDYAWSVTGYPEVLDGQFFQATPLRYGAPLGRQLIRHLDAPGTPFHFLAPEAFAGPLIRNLGDQREYRWEQSDVPALPNEPNTPTWHAMPPLVMKGEFSRWDQVVDWARPLYQLEQPLPREVLATLASWTALPAEQQIAEALRFVQREVRYVAVSLGPHSYLPYPVEQTWQRRFGDCKDKALLLTLILRELGFTDTWPALVNTEAGPLVAGMLPAPGAFDHALVYLAHDGEDYWLDPTAEEQFGPLEQILTPNYRHALILRPGEDQLTAMRDQAYEQSRQEIAEHIEVREYHEPALLAVTARYRGAEADSIRRMFARNPLTDISDHYLAYYQGIYPKARTIALPEVIDDPVSNVVVVNESYEVADFFTRPERPGGRYAALLRASAIDPLVTPPERRERQSPRALPHPANIDQRISIRLPASTANFEPEQAQIDHPVVSYRQDVQPDGDTLHVAHRFRTLRDHVTVAEFPDYLAETARIYEATDYVINAPAGYFGGDSPSEGLTLQLALTVLVTSLLLGCAISTAALVARPGPRWIARNRRRRAQAEDDLVGLGGWLILFGIGTVATAGASIVMLYYGITLLSPEVLHDLTDPSSDAYGPQWRPQLLVIFAWAGVLPLSLTQLFLFFTKRWILPRFAIGMYLVAALLTLVTPLALTPLSPEWVSPVELASEWISWGGSVFVAILWSGYLLVSARVANTFTRTPFATMDPGSEIRPAAAPEANPPGSSW